MSADDVAEQLLQVLDYLPAPYRALVHPEVYAPSSVMSAIAESFSQWELCLIVGVHPMGPSSCP